MSTFWPTLVRRAYGLGIVTIALVAFAAVALNAIDLFVGADDFAETFMPVLQAFVAFFFLCTLVLWIEAWRLMLREAAERRESLDLLWTAALIFLAVPTAWYVCYRARRANVV